MLNWVGIGTVSLLEHLHYYIRSRRNYEHIHKNNNMEKQSKVRQEAFGNTENLGPKIHCLALKFFTVASKFAGSGASPLSPIRGSASANKQNSAALV